MDIDGVNIMIIVDSKVHGCDGWKNCFSIDLQNRISSNPSRSWKVQELRKGRGKFSVLLDVEFCPPPVTSLSIVLPSK